MANWYEFYVTDGEGERHYATGMSLTSGGKAMEKAEQFAKNGCWLNDCTTFIAPGFIRKVDWVLDRD